MKATAYCKEFKKGHQVWCATAGCKCSRCMEEKCDCGLAIWIIAQAKEREVCARLAEGIIENSDIAHERRVGHEIARVIREYRVKSFYKKPCD